MININNIVGIPWKNGGRTPQDGFDCWGFFKWFYAEKLGITIPYDYPYLPGETQKIAVAFRDRMAGDETWIKIDSPENFCGVALSIGRVIHHVGVWVNDGCLHATKGVGVVYNDLKQLRRNGFAKVEFYRCNLK